MGIRFYAFSRQAHHGIDEVCQLHLVLVLLTTLLGRVRADALHVILWSESSVSTTVATGEPAERHLKLRTEYTGTVAFLSLPLVKDT